MGGILMVIKVGVNSWIRPFWHTCAVLLNTAHLTSLSAKPEAKALARLFKNKSEAWRFFTL